MSKLEEIYGKIMATIIVLIFVFSFFYSIFNLLFHKEGRMGLFGSRGNVYMYDDYDDRR